MKKYKVLREMPFCKVGEVISTKKDGLIWITDYLNYCSETVDNLISGGWLAEVPEEKELWEKLISVSPALQYAGHSCDQQKEYLKILCRISRQHFAEVARKVRDSWYTDRHSMVICDQIIQAIESDGEA